MINLDKDLNLIVSHIEELACSNNPGPTAVHAADFIDETFILVPREALPKITFGTLDEALAAGIGTAQTEHLTEKAFDGDFKRMRNLGLQYLVMADYVEQKAIKEQIDTAKLRRYKVFKELFPENIATFEEFDWPILHSFEQMVIDKMVLMHMELDKNF